MNLVKCVTFSAIFFIVIFAAPFAYAIPSFKTQDTQEQSLPAVLKADEIDGDKVTNIMTATGNVEVKKGVSVIYADQISYNKDQKTIRAIGHVKVKDLEIGNMWASEAEVKDDFSSGKFFNSEMVFSDGSYFTSPNIERKTPLVTVLKSPIFSFCPNDKIAADPELAGKKWDFASIRSTTTTIDREKQSIRSFNGILRIYNIPVLYTPYMSVPMKDKKKESGFLFPSYSKTTNFGIGLKIPYYWYIAPNMDLTVTPTLYVLNNNQQNYKINKQRIVNNDFRHMTKYGEYKANLEVANNKIDSSLNTTVVNRSQKPYRWHLTSSGEFDFTEDTGLDFSLNTVSDRNYLRDYHFNYSAFLFSQAQINYIKGRDYYAVRSLKIKELESATDKTAQFILPELRSHVETKPLSYNQRLALTSNVTVINRDSGLQYRRATLAPAVNIPFNVKGNIFSIDAKLQSDFYWLESTSNTTIPGSATPNNNYDSIETNYKPEVSFNWRLPIIQKTKYHTLVLEPIANFVATSYQKNVNKLPNEDSNSSELTISNLFIADRIAGYDRNEAGERISYGIKSSLFSKFGELDLTIGQGYRLSDKAQDVVIRGFANNNKSNIVGQAMFKLEKYFLVTYSFQLNESNYNNEVNQVAAGFTIKRFSFGTDYLLIKKTIQTPQEREQISLSSSIRLWDGWTIGASLNKDLVIGRLISRGITVSRDGCCTIFGFSIVESNPSALIKPQRTVNLIFTFKNL